MVFFLCLEIFSVILFHFFIIYSFLIYFFFVWKFFQLFLPFLIFSFHFFFSFFFFSSYIYLREEILFLPASVVLFVCLSVNNFTQPDILYVQGPAQALVIIHNPHISIASLSKGWGFRGTYRPTCFAASTLSLWVLHGRRRAWAPCI